MSGFRDISIESKRLVLLGNLVDMTRRAWNVKTADEGANYRFVCKTLDRPAFLVETRLFPWQGDFVQGEPDMKDVARWVVDTMNRMLQTMSKKAAQDHEFIDDGDEFCGTW